MPEQDEIEKLLEEQHPLPIVRRVQKKKISVTNLFLLNEFPQKVRVKIIASYSRWIKFEEKAPDQLSFDTIRPFISRPRQETLLQLKEFSEKDPELFGLTFFSQFIHPANIDNPDHALGKKPRRISSYYSAVDRVEFKQSALHLYIFIKHWVQERQKKSGIKLPEEYTKIEQILGEYIHQKMVIVAVIKLLDYYYGSGLEEHMKPNDNFERDLQWTFYTNYIARGNTLRFLKELYRRYQFVPLKNPEPSEMELKSPCYTPLPKYSPLFHPLTNVVMS
ncbi:MAG: hypothetical protein H8E19_08405 [Deltaproteobacteria bacterium]|uniref:Uncharacterized protein n=1 Tax=Candidatus Desulfacyla euxinica TaxID=2841693 RepID=A0A8J6T8B9_9DELT|nr:hypothetical protein [Candidatus Desulfacyla euxinica]